MGDGLTEKERKLLLLRKLKFTTVPTIEVWNSFLWISVTKEQVANQKTAEGLLGIISKKVWDALAMPDLTKDDFSEEGEKAMIETNRDNPSATD